MVGLLFLQKLPKECCLFLLKRIYSVSYILVVLTSVFMGKKILDAWDYTSGPWFEEQTSNVFCQFPNLGRGMAPVHSLFVKQRC